MKRFALFLSIVVILGLSLGRSGVLGVVGERTAEFFQPCDGPDVCSFHFEVWYAGEPDAAAELDVPALGCGPQEVDITELVSQLPSGPGARTPEIRVWSVSCKGVLSKATSLPSGPNLPGYDWVYLDVLGRCVDLGTGGEIRGDANQDADLDITDAIVLLNYMFGSRPLPCGDLDHNLDGRVDISDAVSILMFLFL